MDRDKLILYGGLPLLALLIGGLIYFYASGSVLPGGDSCEWEHVPHAPGQDAHFEEIDEFTSAFAEASENVTQDQLESEYEFRKSDGIIEYKSCSISQ